MFRRRSKIEIPVAIRVAHQAFLRTVGQVERAKASLAAAAPGRRGKGVPLADALAGFEAGLIEAEGSMPAWRTAPVEDAWRACSLGLADARRRAESLRLGEEPAGYEQLYGTLGDLMEPLETFAAAFDRFAELGA